MSDVLINASALVAIVDKDGRSHAAYTRALGKIRDERVRVAS